MKNRPTKDEMAKYIADLPLTKTEKDLLKDAYEAVEKTSGAWEWLKRPDVPGENGFMFCNDPTVKSIIDNMKLAGDHSGGSFAWTMRQMEAIAKMGWHNYLYENFKLMPACDCYEKKGKLYGWCGVVGGGVPACQW